MVGGRTAAALWGASKTPIFIILIDTGAYNIHCFWLGYPEIEREGLETTFRVTANAQATAFIDRHAQEMLRSSIEDALE